jgi:hypothetical protein
MRYSVPARSFLNYILSKFGRRNPLAVYGVKVVCDCLQMPFDGNSQEFSGSLILVS